MENIRNFCIIAHIDHGKSTLADRLLEITGTIEKRRMKEQYLDQLDLERERGITIKMAPVKMKYKPIASSQQPVVEYTLNLIDTPGHTDFSYEVSRALMAVEGAILLVDATQGIQAQTLANFHSAKRAGLTIIGAVNKIDMNPAMLEEIIKSTAQLIGVSENEILRVSGKTGQGVPELLAAVIKKVPAPKSQDGSTFKALIFDSFYHEHKGVVAGVRVFSGSLKNTDTAYLIATQTKFKVKELGHFAPELTVDIEITNGNIGYIATGLKTPESLKIGDTMIAERDIQEGRVTPLAGYKEPQPVVFVSFYPEESDNYENLKDAFGKLRLNDYALRFEADFNEFLGRGFKTGFLGKLHFEITAERLEKEFHIKTMHSFPSVSYRVRNKQGEWKIITNPKDFNEEYLEVQEPIARVEVLVPQKHLGSVMRLQDVFRLRNITTETLGNSLVIRAQLPLADLIRDFDDRLKSISEGYGSLSYEVANYEKTEVTKLEVLVAGHNIGGLTRIVHKDDVQREARRTVEKLKELMPRQQFMQAIQAVGNGRVLARESIPAMKKDVTGYLYGGDRSRKMKLWKKQQRGKKKLKERASDLKIEVPTHVFKELLKK
ncbi:MAG: translation elongation factor 4 [bacterium]|nr:translation elongation factor 4 [bacterium]